MECIGLKKSLGPPKMFSQLIRKISKKKLKEKTFIQSYKKECPNKSKLALTRRR
jgi:hypothetical protein